MKTNVKKEFNEVENKQSWPKLETEGYNVHICY